jgi:hypothetical protein
MVKVRLSQCITCIHIGGAEVQLHTLLTLALVKVSGQLHALTDLPPGKEHLTYISKRFSGKHSWSGHLLACMELNPGSSTPQSAHCNYSSKPVPNNEYENYIHKA